jgi:hypothetical protein
MVVRIRFAKGPKLARKRGRNRKFALATAALLTPAAAMAGVLALWRVAADMKWASRFAIASGFFSHWQVWLAAAILLQLCSRVLNRYGKGDDPAVS